MLPNCPFIEYPLDHCRESVPLLLSGVRANTDPEILYTRVVSVSMGFNCKPLYSALRHLVFSLVPLT